MDTVIKNNEVFGAFVSFLKGEVNRDFVFDILRAACPVNTNKEELLQIFVRIQQAVTSTLGRSLQEETQPNICTTGPVVPSLDHFLNMDKDTRFGMTLQFQKFNDIVLAEVTSVTGPFTEVKLLCFQSKGNKIDDLNMKGHIVPPGKRYNVGTVVRGAIIGLSLRDGTPLLATSDDCHGYVRREENLPLGLISNGKQLPVHFKKMTRGNFKNYMTYIDNLNKQDFRTTVDVLPTYIDSKSSSQHQKVRDEVSPDLKKQTMEASAKMFSESMNLYLDDSFDEAKEKCLEALRLDPKNAKAILHMGRILKATGHYEEAIKTFKKASSLTSSLTQTKKETIGCLQRLISGETDRKRKLDFRVQLLRLNTNNGELVEDIASSLMYALMEENDSLFVGFSKRKSHSPVRMKTEYKHRVPEREVHRVPQREVRRVPQRDLRRVLEKRSENSSLRLSRALHHTEINASTSGSSSRIVRERSPRAVPQRECGKLITANRMLQRALDSAKHRPQRPDSKQHYGEHEKYERKHVKLEPRDKRSREESISVERGKEKKLRAHHSSLYLSDDQRPKKRHKEVTHKIHVCHKKCHRRQRQLEERVRKISPVAGSSHFSEERRKRDESFEEGELSSTSSIIYGPYPVFPPEKHSSESDNSSVMYGPVMPSRH